MAGNPYRLFFLRMMQSASIRKKISGIDKDRDKSDKTLFSPFNTAICRIVKKKERNSIRLHQDRLDPFIPMRRVADLP